MKRIIPRHVHYASEIMPAGGNALLSQIPPLDWARMAFDSWDTFQSFIGVTATNITDIIGEIVSFIQWSAEQIKTVFGNWANMVVTGALGLIDITKLILNYGKENQLYNGDFEIDFNSDGVPDGWTSEIELGVPIFGRSNSENIKGKYSAYIFTTVATAGRFDSLVFPVQGNRKYVVTVCVKGSQTATSPYPVYDIRFFDANQQYLTAATGDATVTTSWVQKNFVAIAPNLARYAKVTLLNIRFNGTIYWDDVQCYEQKNVVDYIADALLPWAKLIQSILPTGLMGTFGVDYALEKFATGFFSATTEGRGKFAANFVQEAMIDVNAVTQSRIKNAEVVWDKLSADVQTKVNASAKWFSEAELNFSFIDGQTTIEIDSTASNLKCIRRLSGAPTQTMWYGPYITLDAGNYWVLFRMKVASNVSLANLIYIGWNCPRTNVGRQLHANDFEQSNVWQTFAVPAEIRQSDTGIEFGGWSFITGITAVYCDYVALIPMAKISTDLLEAHCITAEKIKAYCITAHELHTDCIETDKILAGAVVSAKIALWHQMSDPTLMEGMLWWNATSNQLKFFDGSIVYWIPKFPVAFNLSNIVAFTWNTFLTLCTSGLSAVTNGGVLAPNAVNSVTQITDGLFTGATGLLKFGANLFSGILGRAKFADDLALPFTKLEAVPYKLPTSAYNYIVNPSYEYGTWGGEETLSPDFYKFGKYGAGLECSGANKQSGLSNYIDVRSIYTLTISVWFRVSSYTSGDVHGTVCYYDSAKTLISSQDFGNTSGVTDWTQKSITKTSFPSGTCFIRLLFRAGTQINAYADGWQLNAGDQIPAFQDFTTYSYNWCPEKIETVALTELGWSSFSYTDILQLDFTCESTMLIILFAFAAIYTGNNTGGTHWHTGTEAILQLDGTDQMNTWAIMAGYMDNGHLIYTPYHSHTVLIVPKGAHSIKMRMRPRGLDFTSYTQARRLTILKGFYQGGTT